MLDHSISVLVAGIRWPPETFLQRLLDGLLSSGVQMTVACAPRPSAEWLERPGFSWLPAPHWEGNPGLRMARLGWGMLKAWLLNRQDWEWLRASISQEKGLNAQMRLLNRMLPYTGKRWDVIYFPWNSSAIERQPLFDLGMPVVVSCRGSQIYIAPHHPGRATFREGLEVTLTRATAVHCVCQDIQEEAMKYRLLPEKAWIIRPGLGADFLDTEIPAAASHLPFRVISVGGLSWVKGFEYALQAIRMLKDQGIPVSYQIIGEGLERQRLLYTIHDLELQEQARLLGRLPPQEVRSHLQQADAFLLSSLSEGISNAALEAMACGLPVVSTDCGGMREAITGGVEGYLTPVRNPSALAEALASLWNDPDLRRQMGERGRRRIHKDFSLDQQIAQFTALLHSAAEWRSQTG